MESVDSMSDKQQRTLLENLPSEDQDRQKLDDYKALREELRKTLQVLINWLIDQNNKFSFTKESYSNLTRQQLLELEWNFCSN